MTRTAPDPSSRDDALLMRDVVEVGNSLGRYVVRFVGTDAGRGDHISVADERALAERLTALADGIRARAGRREREGTVDIDTTDLRPDPDVSPSSACLDARPRTPLDSCPTPNDARATAVGSVTEALVAPERPVRWEDAS